MATDIEIKQNIHSAEFIKNTPKSDFIRYKNNLEAWYPKSKWIRNIGIPLPVILLIMDFASITVDRGISTFWEIAVPLGIIWYPIWIWFFWNVPIKVKQNHQIVDQAIQQKLNPDELTKSIAVERMLKKITEAIQELQATRPDLCDLDGNLKQEAYEEVDKIIKEPLGYTTEFMKLLE